MSSSPLRSAMVPSRGESALILRRSTARRERLRYSIPASRSVSPRSPPAPWLDLGWIDNFQRFCATTAEPLRAGARGAPAADSFAARSMSVSNSISASGANCKWRWRAARST